jgi:hypothetical protein
MRNQVLRAIVTTAAYLPDPELSDLTVFQVLPSAELCNDTVCPPMRSPVGVARLALRATVRPLLT